MSMQNFWNNVATLALAVLLIIVLCSRAKATETPASEFVFDAALAADMLTTADIKNHPASQIIETNPLLGQRPSDGKIAAYGAVIAALHYGITRELVSEDVPMPVIQTWEWIGIFVEAGYTAHNYKLGLRIKF
jgi:hypothetical protein